MKNINLLIIGVAMLLLLFITGCCPLNINFIGMTKQSVANKIEGGPILQTGLMKGKFRIKYSTSEKNIDNLGHYFHKDAKSLLSDPLAMESKQWQVCFHLDRDQKWHSYLLTFNDENIVVKQEDRKQPNWVMQK